ITVEGESEQNTTETTKKNTSTVEVDNVIVDTEFLDVDDDKVSNLLKVEKQLITTDGILKPLLEKYKASFGGSYINLKKKHVIVNTLDNGKIGEIMQSPQMKRHRRFLSFEDANKSLLELRSLFNEIRKLSIEHIIKANTTLNVLMYTDMEANNNIVTLSNNNEIDEKFIDSIKKYDPILLYSKPRNITIKTKYIGKSVFRRISPYDFNLIQVTGNEFKLSANEITNLAYKKYPQLLINDRIGVSSHGIHVCKSSLSSFLTCGYTKGLNGIFINKFGIKKDLIITSMISISGDGPNKLSFSLPIEFILNDDEIKLSLVSIPKSNE
ncbi:18394_t:CDS:2, partial [Racocetra persica]